MRKGNVLSDLGFSPEEALALRMKARVSDLLRGKISKFSLETLIGHAEALHMRPELTVHEPKQVLRFAGV